MARWKQDNLVVAADSREMFPTHEPNGERLQRIVLVSSPSAS
jgi:hypothetical protein